MRKISSGIRENFIVYVTFLWYNVVELVFLYYVRKRGVLVKTIKKQYSIKAVVVVTISLLLSVSIAMSLSFLFSYRVQTGQQKKEMYITGMENLSRQMTEKIKDIMRLQKNMATLDITRSFTQNVFANNFADIKKQYITLKGINSYINDIVIVHKNGKIFSCQGFNGYNPEYLLGIKNSNPTGFLDNDIPMYIITHPVYDVSYENEIGKIVFVINGSVFLSDIKSTRVDRESRYVIAYNSAPIKPIVACGYARNLPENWMFNSYNGPEFVFKSFESADDAYSVMQFSLKEYNLISYMIIPQSRLNAEWPENVVLYFVLWCTAVILILALLLRLFSAMKFSSLKIEELLQNIGNQTEVDDSALPISEFHDVAGSIITMSDTINTLSNKNLLAEKQLLEKELSNRKTVLRALRNQINPHFIYNTLSCVKSMGMDLGDTRIPEICDAIIQILRYSIKDSSTALVREEIEALESYLYIQRCRFSGRFSYKISVDDSIMDCQMLRFLLQPILENAIVHGISPQKINGRIIISGKMKGDRIIFDISDTGVGIPPHVLEKINKRLSDNTAQDDEEGHGIGLANINGRLKLFYGDESYIKINSVLNMGTFITISFPKLDGHITEEKNC